MKVLDYETLRFLSNQVLNIPDSWLRATLSQRCFWFIRRFIGLLLALPFYLLMALLLALIVFLMMLWNYLEMWSTLLTGPEPEPKNYEI